MQCSDEASPFLWFRSKEEGKEGDTCGSGGGCGAELSWLSNESDAMVLERLENTLATLPAPSQGMVQHLKAAELVRTSGLGALSPSLADHLWGRLELESVTRLRCNEGATRLWETDVLNRLAASLRVLNLSYCGLAALPPAVSMLRSLQELRVVGNSLKMLPKELGLLTNLRVLAADSNELAILPGELVCRQTGNIHFYLCESADFPPACYPKHSPSVVMCDL
jgi:hypothetical protein